MKELEVSFLQNHRKLAHGNFGPAFRMLKRITY